MGVKAKRREELKYFKEIGDHKVKCKICQAKSSYQSTTSTMRKHMLLKHNGEFGKAYPQQPSAGLQTNFFLGCTGAPTFFIWVHQHIFMVHPSCELLRGGDWGLGYAGLFNGVAMDTGLACSNGLLGF